MSCTWQQVSSSTTMFMLLLSLLNHKGEVGLWVTPTYHLEADSDGSIISKGFCCHIENSVSFPQVVHLVSENTASSHSSLIFNYVLINITLLLTNC